MRGRVVARLCLLVAALVAAPLPAAAQSERPDQSCDAAPAQHVGAVDFGLSQTFTPTVASVTRLQAALYFLGPWSGNLTAGLSVHLPGERASASAGVLTVSQSTVRVDVDRAGPVWVDFPLAAPAPVVANAPEPLYALDLTLPIHVTQTGGIRTPAAWLLCDAPYPRGRPYSALGPRSVAQAGVAIANLVQPGAVPPLDYALIPAQPAVLVAIPGIFAMRFRSFGA